MDLVRLVKKNLALLLPVGITVVAVLLFIPTVFAGKALRSQMQDSLGIGSKIASLVRNTVPANQYRAEQVFQQEHANDANAIELLAQQTSQRQLLHYGIFPEPTETSTAIFMNFGKLYRKSIEDIVADLRAQDCPTDAEIAEVTSTGLIGQTGISASSIATSRNDAIIEQLCKDRAESIPVYASPEVFSGYTFWDNYSYIGRDEAIQDCWKGQLAYWIQKDVADTIAAINKNSSSVLKSGVKRLLGISFSGLISKSDAASRQSFSGTTDLPQYVVSETEGALTFPWTERITNEDIDVVHFACSLIVSNKAVQPFMKELCSQKTHVFKGWSGQEAGQEFVRNQITILKSSAEPIARTSNLSDKYRYGADAVVQLNLVCEYVFNSAGYSVVKPKSSGEKTTKTAAPSRSKRSSNSGSSEGYEP